MTDKLTQSLIILSHHIFGGLISILGKTRIKIALLILPKDVSNFANLIISKMADDIQKMDCEKRERYNRLALELYQIQQT